MASSVSPLGVAQRRGAGIRGWLRERSDRVVVRERGNAGLYGLDLYVLYRSKQEIIDYL